MERAIEVGAGEADAPGPREERGRAWRRALRPGRRSLRKGLVAVGCLVGQPEPGSTALGLVAIALGSALHLWSKGCLEQNRRLTTAGPYRWTRNPFYLANGLIDLGICCVIGRPWIAALYLPLWWIAYRDTIAREERRLASLFPEAFAAYRAAVPRLLPTGRRLPAVQARGRFRLDNDALARGAEYARLLGIWIAPAAIWAAERLREDGLALLDEGRGGLRAMLLAVPAAWILKLALAETFRRPETPLLPAPRSPRGRGRLLVALAGVVWLAAGPLPELALAAALWLGIAWLDGLGEMRRAPLQPATRAGESDVSLGGPAATPGGPDARSAPADASASGGMPWRGFAPALAGTLGLLAVLTGVVR